MTDARVALPPRKPRGPYSPRGVARERKPLSPRGGIKKWRARYVDVDNKVKQCGSYATMREAKAATKQTVDDINAGAVRAPSSTRVPSANEFLAGEWLEAFPRQRTTAATLRERARRALKAAGDIADMPMDELRRAHLVKAQAALLERRLAKETVDGAFLALSQMLRDAIELGYVTHDVADAMKVRRTDPRLNLNPKRANRRALTLEEMYAFIDAVPVERKPHAWAVAICGARPGEYFAANERYVDRRRGLIYLHQTADDDGRLMNGLKGTHHVLEIHKRGRFTLWPRTLAEMFDEVGVAAGGWLVPAPRGGFWALNNFYAQNRRSSWWKGAVAASGVEPFTLYDLRHTFSSWLQAVPIPAVEVSAWMGHSLREGGVRVDTTTARIYTHGTGQWREAALDALEAIMRGEAPRQRSVAGAGENGDATVTPIAPTPIHSGERGE